VNGERYWRARYPNEDKVNYTVWGGMCVFVSIILYLVGDSKTSSSFTFQKREQSVNVTKKNVFYQ
jgi:hypothetical protein